MIGKRYVDGDKVFDEMVKVSRESGGGKAARAIGRAVEQMLKASPRVPKLIGRQRAAEILGVGSPYISELIKAGEMPDAVKIDGGHTVYIEAEVKALAAKRKRKKGKS